MSYLDDLGYSQEEQRLGRAMETAEKRIKELEADRDKWRHACQNFAGKQQLTDRLQELLNEQYELKVEIERLKAELLSCKGASA